MDFKNERVSESNILLGTALGVVLHPKNFQKHFEGNSWIYEQIWDKAFSSSLNDFSVRHNYAISFFISPLASSLNFFEDSQPSKSSFETLKSYEIMIVIHADRKHLNSSFLGLKGSEMPL